MGKKGNGDKEIEDRIRAHIRQRMEQRGLGVSAAARVLKADQGNLSRILRGSRGVSASLAMRVSQHFQIDLEKLFHFNPPHEFWEYYVPKPAPAQRSRPPPATASPVSARPTRRGTEAGSQ